MCVARQIWNGSSRRDVVLPWQVLQAVITPSLRINIGTDDLIRTLRHYNEVRLLSWPPHGTNIRKTLPHGLTRGTSVACANNGARVYNCNSVYNTVPGARNSGSLPPQRELVWPGCSWTCAHA